ncbi:MAG TPA: DHHA1 domain-containing protein, partial [Saprospiraceae bacterium]|nr:DHHA1 domain-containing protein [Saprospiraceae bacterium]
ISRPLPLDITDLVFGMGPLINAAGRLGHARDAVKLLLAADKHSALDAAGMLVNRNRERREVDSSILQSAKEQYQGRADWQTRKSIVLYDPSWHKGVIGITASRLTEEFHRPSVVFTRSQDRAVGSARSVPGFDLYRALHQCEDLFYTYGGHAHAAGMQMPVEAVEAFMERFEEIVRQQLPPESEHPSVEISAEIRLGDIDSQFWRRLQQFAPFGPQNPNPIFVARNLVDTGQSRLLDNNHVRLAVRHADEPPRTTPYKGIGFGLGKAFQALHGRPFDMVFNLREEEWKGQKSIGLYIKHMRPSEIA